MSKSGEPDGVVAVAVFRRARASFGRVRAAVTGVVATVLAAGTMVAMPAVTASAASAGALQVFGWGLNTDGQIAGTPGTGFFSPAPIPLPPGAAGVRQVDTGESSSALVMTDGTVDTWGNNFYGALGDGTRNDHYFPAPVPGLSGITQIFVGIGIMMAVDASGAVWGWGNNTGGELGCPCDPGSVKIVPVKVAGLPGITQVVDGYDHALAVDRSGLVWAWGWDDHGQLGDGTTSTTIHGTPEPVPGLSGIVQVAAAGNTSFALRSDGVLFAWGEIPDGLLGNGGPSGDITRAVPVPGPPGVTQVAVAGESGGDVLEIAGPSHAVWAWGPNSDGEVGNGTDDVPVTSPVQLPLTGAVSISTALYISAAVLNDGSLWVWGKNTRGELGLGSRTVDVDTPRLVTDLAPVTQVSQGVNGSSLAIGRASSSYVTVPDVRGDDLATATTVLERVGLRVGPVSYAPVCGKPGGFVTDQAPEAVMSGIVVMREVLSAISLTIGRHVDFCP
jgi:alpha-tubulin suppressor-like RCC1 family protein